MIRSITILLSSTALAFGQAQFGSLLLLAPPAAGGGGGVDSPDDVSGLELWLKADAIVGLSDNDPVETWADSSGNGRDATQSISSHRAVYKTAILNGLPVIRFDHINTNHFTLPNFLTGFTAGEIFYVVKLDADPPSSAPPESGLHVLGSDAVSSTHFPFSDGTIYDSFGSTARKTTVNPTPALTTFRLYNVQSAASAWTNRLDGVVLAGTGANTVGWTTAPIIGRSLANNALNGDIAEVVFYSKILDEAERDGVEAYFDSKYVLSY